MPTDNYEAIIRARASKELVGKLDAIAAREGRRSSDLIRQAIAEFVRREEAVQVSSTPGGSLKVIAAELLRRGALAVQNDGVAPTTPQADQQAPRAGRGSGRKHKRGPRGPH